MESSAEPHFKLSHEKTFFVAKERAEVRRPMMKKPWILMLALGVTTVANVTLSLPVNGDTSVETIEIPIGTTVWIDVCSDTSDSYWAFLELVDPFVYAAWVGDMIIHPAAGKSAMVVKDPYGDGTWLLIAAAFPGDDPPISPGHHFEIELDCMDYPDAIINLRGSDWDTIVDTLTIIQSERDKGNIIMSALLQSLPYITAIFIAAVYIVVYLCTCKRLPELKNIVVILACTAAIYFSISLMISVMVVADEKLGILKDQKLLIIVGCFALFWVALIAVVQSFSAIKQDKSREQTQVPSEEQG